MKSESMKAAAAQTSSPSAPEVAIERKYIKWEVSDSTVTAGTSGNMCTVHLKQREFKGNEVFTVSRCLVEEVCLEFKLEEERRPQTKTKLWGIVFCV